jgi:hypothetical protein
MRGEIIVETQAEFDMWMIKQEPKYWGAVPSAKPGAAQDSVGIVQPAQKDSVIAQLK